MVALGCDSERADSTASAPGEEAHAGEKRRMLAALRDYERRARRSTDFSKPLRADYRFGADPYRVIATSEERALGLMRGTAELVLLDDDLVPRARTATPRLPSGLAYARPTLFVSSDLTSSVARYELREAGFERRAPLEIDGVHSVRAVAIAPSDVLYAVSDESDLLFSIQAANGDRSRPGPSVRVGRGATAIRIVPGYVIVDCLLDHAVVVLPVDDVGAFRGIAPRIEHQGPIWGVAAAAHGSRLILALGGVENRPLDRSIGSFGYVDSFLYLYELDASGKVTARAALNTSDHRVVTPKALDMRVADGEISVLVTGYGGSRALRASFDSDFELHKVHAFELPPGSADLARFSDGYVIANPLLDAWVTLRDGGASEVVPVAAPAPRADDERLGEALLFTTLIAPANRSEGPLSRFTCETCHFEGYVDGRTHYTGRGKVHATTKPLLGLFNNAPYFSRALDEDLTEVAHHEFRVAGANSGQSPWFTLRSGEHRWLRELDLGQSTFFPGELRQAFIGYLMRFSHLPNPRAASRSSFDALEARGARAFANRCESCHEARLQSDDSESRVAFEAWSKHVFSEAGALVWGSDSYQKTGVVPYVHARGARVPSLRRMYKKYPYFTNGSAKSLVDVLDRARFGAGAFFHDASGVPDTTALERSSDDEKAALLAFLELL
jgi:hypothetical protein